MGPWSRRGDLVPVDRQRAERYTVTVAKHVNERVCRGAELVVEGLHAAHSRLFLCDRGKHQSALALIRLHQNLSRREDCCSRHRAV